ncbi:hypothetical protein MASR1M31_05640 [Porphyromonadaceae bacterium]
MQPMYVIGLDYGTDSCRAIIVNAQNGDEISTTVKHTHAGERESIAIPLKTDIVNIRLTTSKQWRTLSGKHSKSTWGTPERVVGLSFDTTGSTPVITDKNGTPLALLPQFSENPNAMFILWKDHTAVAEAEEINQLAREWEIDFTRYEGGIYSSEWFWAKALHVLRADSTIRDEIIRHHRTLRLDDSLSNRKPPSGIDVQKSLRRGTQSHVARLMGRTPLR